MSLILTFPINLTAEQAQALGVEEDDGLTLTITVHEARRVAGSFSYNAASDLDYRGYEDLDYTFEPDIKLTKSQTEDVEAAIWTYVEDRGL